MYRPKAFREDDLPTLEMIMMTRVFVQLKTFTHPHQNVLLLSLIGIVMLLAVGCATTAHEARSSLVQEMGKEKVQGQLRDLLFRATFPKVTVVNFSDDSIHITSQQTYTGAWYQTVTQQLDNQLYFSLLDRAQLYENNFVFLYRSGNHLEMKILFASQEESKLFIDLLWSLRADYLAKQ